jgi:uncharacterized protein (TIGR03437 family)
LGTNFRTATGVAESAPAPTTLAGLTVAVEDSAGAVRNAPLFFASPIQLNFLLPDGIAAGPATITVANGAESFRTEVLIQPVAPGLFGAAGFAAANVFTLRNGELSATNTIRAGSGGNLELVPIDLGAGDEQVFLILYGTGIRHHQGQVTAKIGGSIIPATYAGPQGEFAGEDQINIELPRPLKGAGIVDVTLSVDGHITNTVKIHIQ